LILDALLHRILDDPKPSLDLEGVQSLENLDTLLLALYITHVPGNLLLMLLNRLINHIRARANDSEKSTNCETNSRFFQYVF
jgi:hypothetical protein